MKENRGDITKFRINNVFYEKFILKSDEKQV